MSIQEKLIKASHLIDMDDIVREGNPTLRAVGTDVELPLSDEDIILGEKMLEFLRNSQDPVMSEKMGLRGGVGLAARCAQIQKARPGFGGGVGGVLCAKRLCGGLGVQAADGCRSHLAVVCTEAWTGLWHVHVGADNLDPTFSA